MRKKIETNEFNNSNIFVSFERSIPRIEMNIKMWIIYKQLEFALDQVMMYTKIF